MLSTYSLIIFLILSIICIILIVFLKNIMKQKYKTQIQKIFAVLFILLLIWIAPMIVQVIMLNYNPNINLKYFYYMYFIGVCYLPVGFLLMAIIYKQGSIKINKKYALLFVIPTISLIMMWTNELHHAFYKEYPLSLSGAPVGWYFYIHSFYTFALYIIALAILIRCSIKSKGILSKQISLIILGAVFPLIVNVLGATNILHLDVYATPIAFSLTLICFTFAILKLNFLDISPIALQTIVNIMSDGYIILDNKNLIIDFNKAFLNMFKVTPSSIKGKRIDDFLKSHHLTYKEINEKINKAKDSKKELSFEKNFPLLKKSFRIEVTSIYSKNIYLGTLILFKDITEHKKDIETIQNNQSILMEKERLATLGSMIGGVAHNLKTPIMSISGATEGLEDLIKEYDKSIEDPEVTVDDHHAIANDMMDWVNKIRSYDKYMSDIITAIKGQAVNMNEDQNETFTVSELLSRVNILMKHELKEGQVALNEDISIDDTVKFKGNVNSLVQVVNNLISNAIQAYPPITAENFQAASGSSFIKGNGSENGSSKSIGQEITNISTSRTIDLIIFEKNDKIHISVSDHGCGMNDEIKNKLFKEMITTKGHNGSGLGLFMSYSTIKGNFHGDMTFTSKIGKGTTFNIVLPRK